MRLSVAVLFAFAATAVFPVEAANISVRAEGVFSEFFDPDGLLPFSEPAPATLFELSLSYDDSTPDFDLGDDFGVYAGAISAFRLEFGGLTFGLLSGTRIDVLDDFSGTAGFIDFWGGSTAALEFFPGRTVVETIGLFLTTESQGLPIPILDSDALVPPFGPAPWDIAEIAYRVLDLGGEATTTLAVARATVTSITVVPIPAALWLFASALGLLALNHRPSRNADGSLL